MAIPRSRAASTLIAVLIVACSFHTSHAQTGNLNNFQCWSGALIAGNTIRVDNAPNADVCATKCLTTAGCTMFSLNSGQQCTLKSTPFESTAETTGRNTGIKTSCILKTVGGSLPSPVATMCYVGQDVAGVELNSVTGLSSPSACVSQCVSLPGCSFSVFRAGGMSGNGVSLCQLKGNAFAGNQPASVTRRDSTVTGICFRALNAPSINDPLSAVAGPSPFIIVTKTSPRCLRVATSPYTSGQVPVFMTDCNSVEALWTYDASTKVVTHYASGLCLAPVDGGNGALVTLTSNCAPSANNQVQSRGSGTLQMLSGNRYLQPAGQPAYEGAMMVASNAIPADQYNFLPSPGQTFQCYANLDVSGDVAASVNNVENSLACAILCQRNPACTFYTFQSPSPSAIGVCNLKYNPFNRNGVLSGATRSPQMAAACFNKAKSGTMPSPANYLCYSNQQISGTILQTTGAANSQACVNMCTTTPGCTFAYYDTASQCTLGYNPFYGNQGNEMNRYNADITNMCLRAPGAPDSTVSKGYICYDGVNVAGLAVSAATQAPSRDECARRCEAMSDTCSFIVYSTSNQQCTLMADAFTIGESYRANDKVSCLRAATGGNMNSPGNYLCYSSQSIAGTEIGRGAGVADSVACANVCAANAMCKFSMYLSVGSGTCILKRDPFYGNENPANTKVDSLVTSVCLAAPGAPMVLSGFGQKPK